MIEKVAKITKEVCGISKSASRKETWWRNNDAVKRALRDKKEKYHKWRSEETRVVYVKYRNNAEGYSESNE